MCLMAFALHPHPALGLLLASNRDEFLDRPTQPLHQWHTATGTPVWAGRDVRDGGTWLGCTPAGRVGMLTNVRDPDSVAQASTEQQPTPSAAATALRSRGELVTRWLDTHAAEPNSAMAAEQLLAWLGPRALDYGGFNLVLGDVAQGCWLWLNNRPHSALPGMPSAVRALTTQPHPHLLAAWLPPGVYGLSNSGLDAPWPKTRTLTNALTQALQSDLDAIAAGQPPHPLAHSPLWHTLTNTERAPDHELPHTGVPWAWEQALSAIWVDMPPTEVNPATETTTLRAALTGYGTRSSLLMRLHRPGWKTDTTRSSLAGVSHPPDWQAQMLERTWRPASTEGWVSAEWTLPQSNGHQNHNCNSSEHAVTPSTTTTTQTVNQLR
ncbi:MAG: NRDE family protein [Burkholderiaceae bacterium]|nr:NRDE family protein [Burkholderiaceae bacterium]